MKKPKQIIGVYGDNTSTKKEFCNVLSNKGFKYISIYDKINEFSRYLLKNQSASDEFLNVVRERGYHINDKFWINLLLSSFENEKEKIVIDNLYSKDNIPKVIFSIYISDTQQVNETIYDKEIIGVKTTEEIISIVNDLIKKIDSHNK